MPAQSERDKIKWSKTLLPDKWGKSKEKGDPEKQRERRLSYQREYNKKYYASHKKEHLLRNKKNLPPLSVIIPGYVPLTARNPVPTPPCGGDCEFGCPYDDCKFPDWDEKHEDIYIKPDGSKQSRSGRRATSALYKMRRYEKRKLDPYLDERLKADNRKYQAKYRAKVKFVKSGGNPEEFEIMWKKSGEHNQQNK